MVCILYRYCIHILYMLYTYCTRPPGYVQLYVGDPFFEVLFILEPPGNCFGRFTLENSAKYGFFTVHGGPLFFQIWTSHGLNKYFNHRLWHDFSSRIFHVFKIGDHFFQEKWFSSWWTFWPIKSVQRKHHIPYKWGCRGFIFKSNKTKSSVLA